MSYNICKILVQNLYNIIENCTYHKFKDIKGGCHLPYHHSFRGIERDNTSALPKEIQHGRCSPFVCGPAVWPGTQRCTHFQGYAWVAKKICGHVTSQSKIRPGIQYNNMYISNCIRETIASLNSWLATCVQMLYKYRVIIASQRVDLGILKMSTNF